jgi:hypothetical protein
MALIQCKECKSEISDAAAACPKCGAKPTKKTSFLTWIVGAVFLVVMYRSCGIVNDKLAQRAEHLGTPAVASNTTPDECSVSDFDVKISRTYTEYGYSHIVGTAKNNSKIPCGVQVKYSTYDKNGAVMRTNDAWPASIRNIGPSRVENFEFMLPADKMTSKVGIEPISTKQWR